MPEAMPTEPVIQGRQQSMERIIRRRSQADGMMRVTMEDMWFPVP